MPVGFCCSKCVLYDENHTCLKTKSKPQEVQIEESERFHPISTEIEGGLLKVVISKKDKKIPIIIDIQKQLESK